MENQFSNLNMTEQEQINRVVERHMNMLDGLISSDAGYMGLYGGLTKNDIRARKQLQPGEEIVNWMSPEELAANIFRASQAQARLHREQLQDQKTIDQVHFQVGQFVRQAIAQSGCTLPENLPIPERSARESLQEELLWLKQSDELDSFGIRSDKSE